MKFDIYFNKSASEFFYLQILAENFTFASWTKNIQSFFNSMLKFKVFRLSKTLNEKFPTFKLVAKCPILQSQFFFALIIWECYNELITNYRFILRESPPMLAVEKNKEII